MCISYSIKFLMDFNMSSFLKIEINWAFVDYQNSSVKSNVGYTLTLTIHSR